MNNIQLFKCVDNEADRIPNSLLEKLGFRYDDAVRNTDMTVSLSKELRKYKNKIYCSLPFGHTVEAEAFGSSIIIDNEVGNRISKYAIGGKNDFDSIHKLDLSNGRISQIIDSVKILKNERNKVCLNITGPISIATSIMDVQLFFKLISKDKERIKMLLEIIEDSIVDFILMGIDHGVDLISYADPTGTIDIVGPKIFEEVSGRLTYNILKRIESKLGNSVVHICGKMSTSLESIGLLEVDKLKMECNSYGEMLDKIIMDKKDIKFIGHWCINKDICPKELIYCHLKN